MKTKAIIFDIDGTLWDITEELALVWSEIGSEITKLDYRFTKEELEQNMGKPLDQIVINLFPYADETELQKIYDTVTQNQCKLLAKYDLKKRLYDGVIDALNAIYLTNEYEIFLVSNCENNYMDLFIDSTRLGFYFVDTECHGNTRKSKKENIRMVLARNKIQKAIYVGDTLHDYAASKNAGIEFSHGKYGFQPKFKCGYHIKSIKELMNVIKDINL